MDDLLEASRAGNFARVLQILQNANNNIVANNNNNDDSGLDEEQGVDVDTRDPETGETCLTVAAAGGHYKCVQALAGHGADLDDNRGALGDSPLHKAVKSGQYNVVVFLLKRGCRTDAVNRLGLTPLFLARRLDMGAVTIAIQLTNRRRRDMRSREERAVLIEEERRRKRREVEKLGTDEENNQKPPGCFKQGQAGLVHLRVELEASQVNLAAARRLVSSLEDQLGTARAMVHRLEFSVDSMKRRIEAGQREADGKGLDNSLPIEMLRCPVCMEVPHARTKVGVLLWRP